MTMLPQAEEITHRAVLKIAFPMMFAYLSTALVGAVSIAAIGQIGRADLSAGIAIGAILFDILFNSLNFLRSTTLGLTAIALGAGRTDKAKAILQRSLILAVGLGLVILVLGRWEIRIGLPLLGAHGTVLQAAASYAVIRVLSAPFALGNYAILGALLGRGRAIAGLALQLILNGTNILCCIWTVLVLHWGVRGAALSAVSGETLAFVAGLVWLRLSTGPLLGQGLTAAWRDGTGWRQMGVLNRDTLIRSLALLFTFAFFTRQGAVFGAATLAANAIHMQFFALSANCLDGFAAAAEQMAGRMIGARDTGGFRRAVRLTFGWSLISGAAITLVYLVFGQDFVALLTTAADVRADAGTSLVWAALVPVMAAGAFQLDGVFIGATWSRDMRNMMLLSLAVFLVAWAVLMPAFANAGLWAAFLIFLGVRGVTLGIVLLNRMKSGRILVAFGD
ncbi:MATE family efflux transporter [Acidisoma cellulosilytica]|uniref:MATE family efflux transporter n=1 Tax=Acidisoma cellulosilyticum TaxID=2802395 RepID=A0A964E534_9PROT|nr:MATE family efflux transporter [Acidisoma cellulosilyticum]MCB8881987.1 MATE family efflux transporter [Acidisoma cellulosilyticum]